jgi:SAM-dependent methyltransferase
VTFSDGHYSRAFVVRLCDNICAMKYYEEHEKAYRDLINGGFVGWGKKKDIAELFDFSFKQPLQDALLLYEGGGSKIVLDLGCGTGPVSLFCSQNGYQTTGVDVSQTAVSKAYELAKELGLSSKFICGDFVNGLTSLPRFSIIIDSSFLHCIVFDEDRAKCLSRIYDLLEPGGIFILHTMTSDRSVDFGNNFELDENGVLWCLYPSSQASEAKLGLKGLMSPQRRLLPSSVIEKQLNDLGFLKVKTEKLYSENLQEPITLFGTFKKPR